MGKKIFVLIIVSVIFLIGGCYSINEIRYKGDYMINNINIYKNTPAWELAQAVKGEKTKTIEKIAKDNPGPLNYQEAKYGATLLLWSVGMEKYKSAETLLKCGADPNIASTVEGETPLFLASGFSWVDTKAKKDAKYVKLLLNYGADPNKNYIGYNSDEKKYYRIRNKPTYEFNWMWY